MRHGARAASTASIAVGVLLAVLGVVVGVGGSAASALPLSVPVAFDFGVLPVGATVSDSAVLDVPFDSRVVEVEVATGGPPGEVAWSSRLCSAAGECLTLVDGQPGWPVVAGAYTLQVSATGLTSSTSPSTLSGRILFAADPLPTEGTGSGGTGGTGSGGLAATGSTGVVALAALSLTAVVVGAVLSLVAGRRERDETQPA